jgi:hypothetical protein
MNVFLILRRAKRNEIERVKVSGVYRRKERRLDCQGFPNRRVNPEPLFWTKSI